MKYFYFSASIFLKYLPYICLAHQNPVRMKKLFQLAVFASFLLLLNACSKNRSSDLPLPVVRKEAVYVTTNNNNLISYHPGTGAKQWEVNLKGSCEGVPVLYNKKLYLVTNAGYFYSIDILKGEIYLEKNIQKPNKLSMALNGSNLVMAGNDSLYCFTTNGDLVWNYSPGASCTSSPQVANGRVYVGAGPKIHAVDAGNGAGVWTSFSASGLDILSSPRVSNGLVYFGGQDKYIYAANESNGSLKWRYLTNDKVVSSPLVYGGMCIAGSADFGIYCIDTTSPTAPPNGELRWVYQTKERIMNSSPAVHVPSNTILVGSYDFNLYAIDHVTGTLKWKYPAGSIIKSSPVVYGNYVYFSSVDRYLYCVDVRNGATVWKALMNGSTENSPMVDDLKNGIYPSVSGMSAN